MNSHAPSRHRLILRLIPLLVLIACILAGGTHVWRYLQVDRCLDNGGRWLSDTRECEY